MKWLAMSFHTGFVVAFLFVTGFSQTEPPKSNNSDVKWIRVISDDGEFSVEVPQKNNYFFDKNGFFISEPGSSGDYSLQQMRILKGFVDETLVGFECYKAEKGAIKALFKHHSLRKNDVVESEIKKDEYVIRQAIRTNDDYSLIRQYFYSKKNIYVLTAASRKGETRAMRRFFDSLIFSPKGRQINESDGVKLSDLPAKSPAFELKLKKPPSVSGDVATLNAKEKDEKPLIFLYKPYPRYTEAARQKNVSGTIVLRITFAPDGTISRIAVVRELPEGLLQQALLSALRIDFLPAEKKGISESVTKDIEYSFNIY